MLISLTSDDLDFKDLASQVVATLVDFDLMRSDERFNAEERSVAAESVARIVDQSLQRHGYDRLRFYGRLRLEGAELAATFVNAIFATIAEERRVRHA